MLSLREGVELFHIAFLAELGTKLDKARYAVKGGCNLRFFFKSPRYSEDLDLDVGAVPVPTLQSNVKRVIAAKGLLTTLASVGIQVTSSSAPKQTETTQRWKVGLRLGSVDAHTKIEFSRRNLQDGRAFGPIEPKLVAGYGLSPVLVSHYDRSAALSQKYGALLGRSETQARDVFDLDLLLQAGGFPAGVDLSTAEAAAAKALSLDHGSFMSQVVAYLPAALQPLYREPSVWAEMQVRVVAALRGTAK